jgi:hypothetical protein
MMRHPGRLSAILALFVAAALHAGEAAEQAEKQSSAAQVCQSFRVREQDQIWLVSTRHLGCAIGGKYQPTFQVWRYEKGVWQPRTVEDFYAEDSPDLVTPIYVHGNRIDAHLASSYGLSFYFEFAGKLYSEPPVRFVIWSWPADQIRGPLKDVRSKAARSDYEAFFLGSFLSRMQPEVRVGLLGFSFGARIISGAMHLAEGGQIFGATIPDGPRARFRVAMWSAAEHNHWYQPGQFHDRAIAAAEAWFIPINPCDPVLARYRHIDPCGCPAAVGYAGISGRNLLPAVANARIEEVNVSNIVGSQHDWRPYLYSLYIQNRTRDYILWHDLGLSSANEAAALTAAK